MPVIIVVIKQPGNAHAGQGWAFVDTCDRTWTHYDDYRLDDNSAWKAKILVDDVFGKSVRQKMEQI